MPSDARNLLCTNHSVCRVNHVRKLTSSENIAQKNKIMHTCKCVESHIITEIFVIRISCNRKFKLKNTSSAIDRVIVYSLRNLIYEFDSSQTSATPSEIPMRKPKGSEKRRKSLAAATYTSRSLRHTEADLSIVVYTVGVPTTDAQTRPYHRRTRTSASRSLLASYKDK